MWIINYIYIYIGKLEEAMEVKLNYESYVFKPGNGHEINDKLIDKIAKSD